MPTRRKKKTAADFAKPPGRPVHVWLERFSAKATHWAGSSTALVFATGLIFGWILSGPLFDYSENWQLFINTVTTIITFLMVFLIQRSQNKESLSVQLKLSEAIASLQGASNRLISVEDLSEDELEVLRTHYQELARLAKDEADITKTHSVEDAKTRHAAKKKEN